jgi:hypothetical protein
VSPILVRPVREQLEHDRIIRFLQNKLRRRHEVGINPGTEQTAPAGTGAAALYPDLVLSSLERGRRLEGVIEVETGESVNHLEALAEWGPYSRLRADFHLYVPAGMVDVARRLCEDNHIHVNEIWSYHAIGDQVRFTMVHRSREQPAAPSRPRTAEPRATPAPRRKAARAAKAPARRKPTKAKKAPRAQKRR